jgi:hypothetical protein
VPVSSSRPGTMIVPPCDPVALAERISRLQYDAVVDRLGRMTRARFEAIYRSVR